MNTAQEPGASRVRLVPGGLVVGGERVPLWAASVHYWHLDPADWRACLEAVRRLGFRVVDTYVPWSVHETGPGSFDLGKDPRKDVARFLRLAEELGLYAIVRPGPHINGELTNFGIPERVVWDPACQARGPSGAPVVLPMMPVAFPVPSYASQAFFDETARWYERLGEVLAPLVHPHGPIVMIQVDNEGALYFRDGAYDQDWHPDAIALYRQFLRDKYKTLSGLAAAYGFEEDAEGAPRFGDIEPPTRFDAETAAQLPRHVDWAEFHEVLLATAMTRFSDALVAAGFDGIPRTHNFPPGQEATPLNAARVVGGAVDLVGLDYYGKASEAAHTSIRRRTTELAVRTEARGVPAFACEMGAGFPPFFPPLDERDSAFTILAALAYGLRGFNAYMAVERDRWIGAPIDPRGRERPFADFWRRLIAALERVGFAELRRVAPVRILIPRNERRLARVTHAFGPITAAFFSVAGSGARDACLEDDFGAGSSPAIDVDTFVRALELALDARGVPFSLVGGESKADAIAGASWVVAATSGGLSPVLFDELASASTRGTAVTLGPRAPELGGARRVLLEPHDLSRLVPREGGPPPILGSDPRAIDAAVASAITALGLPTWSADPEGVFTSLHEDAEGRPRVLFVIRPGGGDVLARVGLGSGLARAVDLLEERSLPILEGVLEVRTTQRSSILSMRTKTSAIVSSSGRSVRRRWCRCRAR
jgi:beta-galactosidase